MGTVEELAQVDFTGRKSVKSMEVELKHNLVIYERREVVVLVLLALVAGLFTFTYGLHLGKTVVSVETPRLQSPTDHPPVKTVPDEIPNRQELTEQGKAVPQASEEALDEALSEEVGKSGAHIDVPKQIELPTDSRHGVAGATLISQAVQKPTEAPKAVAAVGRYTLQVGSFPTQADAAKIIDQLKSAGLSGQQKPVEITGKGKWHRVYVGGYATKAEAEKAGQDYKTKKAVSSFIVVETPH